MVELKLTDKQARIAARACELYARIVLGQFNEVILDLVDSDNVDEITSNREEIENLLLKVRSFFYPDLHGVGHSYGIGKFEHADRAYDVYQAIRSLFADPRIPFSYYKIPEARRFEDTEEVEETPVETAEETEE